LGPTDAEIKDEYKYPNDVPVPSLDIRTKPLVWSDVGEEREGLNPGFPYKSQIRDVERMGKFLVTTEGVAFLAKRALMQTLNPRKETKLFNPLALFHVPNVSYQYQPDGIINASNGLGFGSSGNYYSDLTTTIDNTTSMTVNTNPTTVPQSTAIEQTIGQSMLQGIQEDFNSFLADNKTLLERIKDAAPRIYQLDVANNTILINKYDDEFSSYPDSNSPVDILINNTTTENLETKWPPASILTEDVPAIDKYSTIAYNNLPGKTQNSAKQYYEDIGLLNPLGEDKAKFIGGRRRTRIIPLENRTVGYGFGNPGKPGEDRRNIYNVLNGTSDFVNMVPYDTAANNIVASAISDEPNGRKDLVAFRIHDLKNDK